MSASDDLPHVELGAEALAQKRQLLAGAIDALQDILQVPEGIRTTKRLVYLLRGLSGWAQCATAEHLICLYDDAEFIGGRTRWHLSESLQHLRTVRPCFSAASR